MPVLNVALVGSEDLARKLGKKGDTRDIESYVHKESRDGEVRVLSLLRPLKFPESIRPLLSVLDVAKAGLLEIRELSASVGEAMVALGCSGISRGSAIISPDEGVWIDSDQVRVMLDQAGLGDWEVVEGEIDEHGIRDRLFEIQDQMAASMEKSNSSPLILPVDQHFNVKGVGLVAIGYVQSGKVSKHDEVEVMPASDVGVVRSLQVMDDDVDAAITGDRVGVALRNLREQSLHRGCMICIPGEGGLVSHEKSSFELGVAPFQRKVLSVGEVIHAASDLQFSVGRVSALDGDSVTVDWESPFWIRTDGSSRVLIVQLDATPMRIMGTASGIETIG
ncbi:MAG: EF-Tu/IF-2/RF-3 family GTPase [Candidatus Thalassarchaeaceae archaeon]|nr:EF-Tu/IF-2/RF-3 family GTPase [Candidatus Thalassarchaeaceae archaeon]